MKRNKTSNKAKVKKTGSAPRKSQGPKRKDPTINTDIKKAKVKKKAKSSLSENKLNDNRTGKVDKVDSGINIRQVDDSKEIINIAYIIIGLFILVICYYAYFMVTKSEDIINNSYNKRQDLLSEQIVRGDILSADGKTLAHTLVRDDGSEVRVYPYGDLFAHAVGRFSKGRTGIESSENFRLLTSNTYGLKKIFMDLTGQKNLGDNVVTTLNYDLQKVAYDSLGKNKGAIIVTEPSSGKILAMVSKPTYDPNNIDNIWEDIRDDNTNKPLMNRATSEAYPPGSIFKIVTVLEYIRQNQDYENFTYDCDGTYSGPNGKITCGRAHGKVDLKKTIALSCNCAMGYIGQSLDPIKFKATIESLNLATYLPSNLDYNHVHTVIGQENVKVSPIAMAEFISALANGGVGMELYFTDYISNSDGKVIKKFTPEIKTKNIEASEARVLTDYMAEVVSSGTATSLQSDKYTAAGKTGTAQNQVGSKAHSWFIGFANTDKAEIAVTIILENAGSSSKNAVPIAKEIFNTYFNNK
ncbi:MAG: penicillin-binding protein 2 [Clostridiales bacterium]|nr:penicillin-binding protein 2 [Clostridiales bacterium]